ncbi:hypothetical protein D3C85_535930 [compost metagenome]
MTLAGTARAKLADVVVVLNEGNHAGQQVPLHIFCQGRRFHADRANQRFAPLHGGQCCAPVKQLLHVHIGHLDRFEQRHPKRRAALALLVVVAQRGDYPDTTYQQLFVFLDDAG